MTRDLVNRPVNITSVYFNSSYGFKSFPRRMEYEGREYNFIESGLSYRVRSGDHMMLIYDMSDGNSSYRLKFNQDKADWVLVSISYS